MHTCIHAYMHACVHTHTQTHSRSNLSTKTCVHLYGLPFTGTYMRIHTFIRSHTHTLTKQLEHQILRSPERAALDHHKRLYKP